MSFDEKDIQLRGKVTFTIGGKKLVLKKNAFETRFHVYSKALVYALFIEQYFTMDVEPPSIGRYKPDLVAYQHEDVPQFWAECGKTKKDKIAAITSRFRHTHFVFVKRPREIRGFHKILDQQIHKKFIGQVDLIEFPMDLFEDATEHHLIELNDVQPRIISVSSQ